MNDAGPPERSREATATVRAPVPITTTPDGDEPSATTVNTSTSPSLHPPMLLITLDLGGPKAFGLPVRHPKE